MKRWNAIGASVLVMAALGTAVGFAPTAKPVPATESKVLSQAEAFNVDTVHSSLVFRIRHMGVSNFYGRFNTITGTYTFDPKDPSSATFDVAVASSSIDTANSGRDKHLKGGEFFDVEKFPQITFKAPAGSVKAAGEGFEMAGELTLLGKSKPVTAKLTHIGEKSSEKGTVAGFEATFTIKRSDFGMNYGVANGALGDEVMLIVSVEGKRK